VKLSIQNVQCSAVKRYEQNMEQYFERFCRFMEYHCILFIFMDWTFMKVYSGLFYCQVYID